MELGDEEGTISKVAAGADLLTPMNFHIIGHFLFMSH